MLQQCDTLISSEEVIRVFDDASGTSNDSYAVVWWADDEPVIAEPYALCFPVAGESHRRYYARELPADFKIL